MTPFAVTNFGSGSGEVAFATVYRGYQPSIGREVAIKIVKPEFANHPAFIRRFESEARFVASLEHPHIVSVYDYWRDADGAYVVGPYLAGRSLADAIFATMSMAQVIKIASQVGSALSYAHRQGVLHRDIKPANILLDGDGNAYLADFGIAARAVEAATGFSRSRSATGPPRIAKAGQSMSAPIFTAWRPWWLVSSPVRHPSIST